MGLLGSKPLKMATNGPRHWPEVWVEKLDRNDLAALYLQVAAPLMKGLELAGDQARVSAFLHYRLFDEGIVRIPFEVEDDGRTIAVFVYPDASPESSGHFSGVRQLLKENGEPPAVYYSPEPIQPTKPLPVLQSWDASMFSKVEEEEELPKGEYAMWWPTTEQPRFSESVAFRYLDRSFRALDGWEPYLFSFFVNQLDLLGKTPQSILLLPDEPLIQPLEGPEYCKMFLCASAEKGISFAFHVATTPARHRDIFYRLYAAFSEVLAEGLVKAKHSRAPAAERQVLGWWSAMISFMRQKEAEGASDIKVGVIREE